MNQLCVYIYPVFFVFSSDSSHHRTLSRVPCAVEYVLIITVSFPHGTGVKNLPATTGDTRDAGSIPALGISRDWTNVLIIYSFYESESVSCSVVSDSLQPHSPWNSSGQNTGLGNLSLLQGIFPTQGSNPGLPHCRWILCQLSHKGSLGILGWVAYPFSNGPSRPRNQTGVSCIAGRFFTNWAIREAWYPFYT